MSCTTPKKFNAITFSECPCLKENKRPNLAAEHTNPLSSSLKVLRRCLARDVFVCGREGGGGRRGEIILQRNTCYDGRGRGGPKADPYHGIDSSKRRFFWKDEQVLQAHLLQVVTQIFWALFRVRVRWIKTPVWRLGDWNATGFIIQFIVMVMPQCWLHGFNQNLLVRVCVCMCVFFFL